MKKSPYLNLPQVTLLGSALLYGLTAHAQTLTFESIDWYRGDTTNTTLSSVTDGTLGTALSYSQSADTTLDQIIGVTGSSLNLGTNVGDYVQLSFDFRFTSFGADSEDNALRFGIYSDGSTAITEDFGPGSNVTEQDDTGYFAFISNLNTGDYNIGFEDASHSSILTGTDVNGSFNTASGFINDTSSHSVVFSLTRAASGIDISLSVDGSTIVSGNDASSSLTTFNQIAISLADGSSGVFNNFTLEAVTIPEPSTYAMCALMFASFATLVWRRRRS